MNKISSVERNESRFTNTDSIRKLCSKINSESDAFINFYMKNCSKNNLGVSKSEKKLDKNVCDEDGDDNADVVRNDNGEDDDDDSCGGGDEGQTLSRTPLTRPTVVAPQFAPRLRDITNSALPDERVKAKCRQKDREKRQTARERWEMLAKALFTTRVPVKTENSFLPLRFTTFDLIKPTRTENSGNRDGYWLEYAVDILDRTYRMEIRHVSRRATVKELAGFNNTGNICVWPSEEVLAYYLLSNLPSWEGKDVLELGGGMTCLAGMFLARYGKANRVDLTDGNPVSADNVRKIIKKNELDGRKVTAFQLDWANHRALRKTYDLVLSADCLFFDESREELAETVWTSLRDDGTALMMAPKRGKTMARFVEMAEAKGFRCALLTCYDDVVWKRHLTFSKSVPQYDPDVHFPLLLLLQKPDCQ